MSVAMSLAMSLAVGCGDDGDGGDDLPAGDGIDPSGGADGAEDNDAPTLRAVVDASAECGSDGTLFARATLIGCVDPPPAPCTVPEPPRVYMSDAVECPADSSSETLRVEVALPGRYNVEVVAAAADGSESAQCWSDSSETEVIVDEAAFDDNPTIDTSALGSGPC